MLEVRAFVVHKQVRHADPTTATDLLRCCERSRRHTILDEGSIWRACAMSTTEAT